MQKHIQCSKMKQRLGILLIISFLFSPFLSLAQDIPEPFRNVCKNKQITVYLNPDACKKQRCTIKRKNGKIYCDTVVFIEDRLYVGFGRKEKLIELQTKCNEITSGGLFNNHANSKKYGMWLSWYPWGTLRKVTQYKENNPLFVLYFRPNGTISKLAVYVKQVAGGYKVFWDYYDKNEGKLGDWSN
jgi:antitoxin component YwqK of YwqJK toxin-antitoxin module